MQTISQIVKETISDVMLHNLRGQITSTSKLSALGMNSMDKVTLVMELERKLKITNVIGYEVFIMTVFPLVLN